MVIENRFSPQFIESGDFQGYFNKYQTLISERFGKYAFPGYEIRVFRLIFADSF
jgi:hypothetical protein